MLRLLDKEKRLYNFLRNNYDIENESLFFMGFLANCDSSFLGLPLEHNSNILCVSPQICCDPVFSNGTFRPILDSTEPGPYVVIKHIRDKAIYKEITKPFRVLDIDSACWIELEGFRKNYLLPLLEKLRLLCKGDPCLYHYFYIHFTEKDAYFLQSVNETCYSREKCILATDYLLLMGRVNSLKLPFRDTNLMRAHEIFEFSIRLNSRVFSFISLVIALECLLLDDRDPKSFQLARSLAILIGGDYEERRQICAKMKEIYKLRSDIVHKGTVKLNDSHRNVLREYVRRSIIKFNEIGLPKKELKKIIYESGFKQEVWDDRNG